MDYKQYENMLRSTLAGTECTVPPVELEARQAALRQAMEAFGVEVLLVTDPSDLFYLTGYSTFEVSVHACLVVSPQGLVLQVPSIEMGPAVTCTHVALMISYAWQSPDQVIDQLLDVLPATGRIGLDSWSASLRHGIAEALVDRLGKERFINASGLVDKLRIVKSPLELQLLRESARIAGIGLDRAAQVVREGALDCEVAAAGSAAMFAAGSEFTSMPPIVSVGQRSSIIHTSHGRHRIAQGESVFMEFGAAYHRYTAPMMRTVVAGTATNKMREVFESCRTVLDVLCRSMKPGNTFHEAAVAAEQALAPLSGEVFFSGVYGYAVGAQFPPSWVEGSGYIARDQHTPFQENMVFHLPLCLRIPGLWGMGFSETVCVGADGAEPITANRWEL